MFFGKSQDFSFHAFDSKKYIRDFNSIIKDFDELESKIFTVDDISNQQLLAKYIFNQNGKTYSVLKLYSFAQAFSGGRIAGSIYGVALLSDSDIKISNINLSILSVAKEAFARISLDGLKFKTSNFMPYAEDVWKALINNKEGNLLEKIDYNDFNNLSVNNKVKAFWVKDLLKDSVALNKEIENTSRLYFSDDLAHLKRTQVRWGKEKFPFYHLENNSYVLYEEKKPEPLRPPRPFHIKDEVNIDSLSLKINALKKENADISIKFKRFQEQMANKLRMVFISTVVLGLIVLIAMIVLVFKINNKIHREISRLSYQYNITPSDERYDGIEYSEQIYTETEAQSVNSITFHIDNLNIQNDFQLQSVTHIIFNPPGSASIADINWEISPAGVVTIDKYGYIEVNQDKRTSEDQTITATAFIKNQNMGSFTFTVVKKTVTYTPPQSIIFHIDNLNIQNDFQLQSVTHIIFNPPGSASIADITWKISPAGVVTINKKGYIKVNQDKRTSEDQIITATAFIKNQNMGSFTFTVIKQEAAVEKKSNMIKDDSNGGVIIKELDTTGVNKAK